MRNAVPVVLLADDDNAIRTLVASFLESAGYKVLRACNGCEALALWKRCPSEIDLLITDIEMPGMSGIELIDQLNRSHAAMPMLIISGSSGTLDTCDFAGINGAIPILAKPFDLRVLIHMVAALIQAAPERASAVS